MWFLLWSVVAIILSFIFTCPWLTANALSKWIFVVTSCCHSWIQRLTSSILQRKIHWTVKELQRNNERNSMAKIRWDARHHIYGVYFHICSRILALTLLPKLWQKLLLRKEKKKKNIWEECFTTPLKLYKLILILLERMWIYQKREETPLQWETTFEKAKWPSPSSSSPPSPSSSYCQYW